jgi:hypothetical protein
MNGRKAIRLCGVAAIVGGFVNPLVDALNPSSGSPLEWGYFVGGLAIQFALIGIYAIQVEESGLPGLLGFVTATVGRAYFLVPGASIGGMDATAPLGGLYALGLILLAVGCLKARRLPRWVPSAWVAAVLIGVPGAAMPSIESLSSQLGAIAIGLGFIGAGYTLLTSQGRP